MVINQGISVHMEQSIGAVTFVVKDYDEAIEYFTKKLQFDLIEDFQLSEVKRWVLVSPKGSGGTSLLLAKASDQEQDKSVGNQTGGRVAFFLHTDDFGRDYTKMKGMGVNFLEEPREESYGKVVIFQDLYGNKWDFIQYYKSG
ncbi:MAG: VOC family protein [Ignavibacteriales bacterium]|nr:VOC family protein [Ignavibacteriales bacterium]